MIRRVNIVGSDLLGLDRVGNSCSTQAGVRAKVKAQFRRQNLPVGAGDNIHRITQGVSIDMIDNRHGAKVCDAAQPGAVLQQGLIGDGSAHQFTKGVRLIRRASEEELILVRGLPLGKAANRHKSECRQDGGLHQFHAVILGFQILLNHRVFNVRKAGPIPRSGFTPLCAEAIRLYKKRMKRSVVLDCSWVLATLVVAYLGIQSALGSPGTVVAWGGGQTNLPAGLTNINALSCSIDHSLALHADGAVSAWGCDDDGECDVPAGVTNATAVSAGDFFSLALLANGTVVAWGLNDYGQCDTSNLENVVAISAGHAHGLALQKGGTVLAWGSGVFGQTNIPAGLLNPVTVTAAGNDSMALLTNGTVEAWGLDASGQTNVPAGLASVTELAGAQSYALAVESNGTVVAWGTPPPLPAGLSGVVAAAAGEYHSLALTASGSVLDWGANQSGEGVVPNGLSNVVAVAAGWSYSLALCASAAASPPSLELVNPAWTNNTFSVNLQSQLGLSYTLQSSTLLAPPTWTVVQSMQGTGGTLTLTDSSASDAQRFYRVQAQ